MTDVTVEEFTIDELAARTGTTVRTIRFYNESGLLPPAAGAIAQDPLAALILCHAPRVDRLIVAGRTVVKDGRILGMDLPVLIERFNKLVGERFRE